jgi:hypothetical protein
MSETAHRVHTAWRCHGALGSRSGRWPNNRADEENQLRRIPVPARDYSPGDLALSMDGPRDARASSAIWPTLGCSYLFGLWRNFVADLDEIRGLAPNYLGGLWSPIEPAGLASSGPTGLPSCVRLPSHSRNLLNAELSGGPSIGLLCRHDRPCDSSCLVCQGDGGDVEMPPAQKPGEPSAFHLTAPHTSHSRPSAMNE